MHELVQRHSQHAQHSCTPEQDRRAWHSPSRRTVNAGNRLAYNASGWLPGYPMPLPTVETPHAPQSVRTVQCPHPGVPGMHQRQCKEHSNVSEQYSGSSQQAAAAAAPAAVMTTIGSTPCPASSAQQLPGIGCHCSCNRSGCCCCRCCCCWCKSCEPAGRYGPGGTMAPA